MNDLQKSPAELRSMFGSNLRTMAREYPSVSELARRLGINRTQFNRYLAGESFPRPDVLARICAFFGVDARVLLEPVETLDTGRSLLEGPELAAFLGGGTTPSETQFPTGFYRFLRRSFVAPDRFAIGLVRTWRNEAGNCFLRGFEAREAMRQQGLDMTAERREFRGTVLALDNGIGMLIARRQAMTASFNFLHPVVSFDNNFWSGYVARTVPESPQNERVTRMVYEHLGTSLPRALDAARGSGLVEAAAIPSFVMRLLQGQSAFR